MFKSFNFAAANLMMFMMGFMLFSTLVLIPEFLQTLKGYTAGLAGLVLSGGGVVLLVMMPITGRLTSKIQARYLIAMGWLCLAIGLILFGSPARFIDQLRFCNVAAHHASHRNRISFRSDHGGRLHRNSSEEKGNSVIRNHQFHAQHRRQHRNFAGDHADHPAIAISPANPGRPRHAGYSTVSFVAPRAEFRDRTFRPAAQPTLTIRPLRGSTARQSTGTRVVLHGHVLDSRGALLAHVRSRIFL